MTVSGMTKIERSVVIRAPRERVWRAISNIHEFAKWFGVETTAKAFVPGEQVELISTHEGQYKGVGFFVVVGDMVPHERMSWGWHPGAVRPEVDYSKEPMTTVAFTLQDVEGGTKVTVVESGFDQLPPARQAGVVEENTAGWEFQMASLERYVSGAA